jgi:putative transposase
VDNVGDNRPLEARPAGLARLHRRVRSIRRDFLHQLTTHLANTKSVIVVEDLNVNGRLQNPYLARHIADSGWSAFRRMPAYKCTWYGSRLVVRDRYDPSRKTCSSCGHVLEVRSLDVRAWDCPVFGAHHDRDGNAARNLLAMAGSRAYRQVGGT